MVGSEPRTDRLNIYAFPVQVEDIAAKHRVLADDGRRRHQFRHGRRLGLAIIVHQPHVRAGKSETGAHSHMKAAGAASILFQSNCVKVSNTVRSLGREQLARRLIRSIVDHHELADWVSLRVNRSKTSFKERWAVSRYNDCRHTDHERRSLNYKRLEIIVPAGSFSFVSLGSRRG